MLIMYHSPVPLMVIRPDVHALIEVNGHIVGECAASSHTALPISDSGDYYVCVIPLGSDMGAKRYAVTRKISFEEGALKGGLAPDVTVCGWPGGVFEFTISTGSLESGDTALFPYTISTLTLPDERELTLYYENGLKLSVQSDEESCYALTLGPGSSGRMELIDIMDMQYVAVFAYLETGERLILLDEHMHSALDITGYSIQIKESSIIKIDGTNTLMGHEKRTYYTKKPDGTFAEQDPETGFFTHEYEYPKDHLGIATAFCEAVRESLFLRRSVIWRRN